MMPEPTSSKMPIRLATIHPPKTIAQERWRQRSKWFVLLTLSGLVVLLVIVLLLYPDRGPRPLWAIVSIVTLFILSAISLAPFMGEGPRYCCITSRGITFGDGGIVYLKYRHLRRARLWRSQEKGLTFQILSLIRTSWRIDSFNVVSDVSEDSLREALKERTTVLDGPPTEAEEAMQRLSKPTWRLDLGFLSLGMLFFLGLFFAAGLAARSVPQPDQIAPASQTEKQSTATQSTSSSQASHPSEVDRLRKGFSRALAGDWYDGILVATGLLCLVLALAAGAFFLWERTHRIRIQLDYLLCRLSAQ